MIIKRKLWPRARNDHRPADCTLAPNILDGRGPLNLWGIEKHPEYGQWHD